jgi:hypothetical protein
MTPLRRPGHGRDTYLTYSQEGNVYTAPDRKEIKLWTPEGVKEFPLDRMEIKTTPIADGSNIVVELNEQGTVIDVRKAQ